PDPESCGSGCKATGEALTGAHAGQPLSCEITVFAVPTPSREAEGNTAGGDMGKPSADPAQSQDPAHAWKLLAREPGDPTGIRSGVADRPEKVVDRTSGMYACGKSDSRILPEKPPNKGARPAEAVEGRRPIEGNSVQVPAPQTLSWTGASCGLHWVRVA